MTASYKKYWGQGQICNQREYNFWGS